MIALCRPCLWPALLLALAAPAPAPAGELTDQIRQTTDKIIAIVQDPSLKAQDKEAERQSRIRKAADERFDWETMARSAMGPYWRTLSGAQRKEFSDLFGRLIEQTYMDKVENYAGEKIIYKGDTVDGQYGVGDVVIVSASGADIPVQYRVLNKGAQWMVYDVSVEGVSLVNNYRSQISSILNSSSYDELIKKIKAKLAGNTSGQGGKDAGHGETNSAAATTELK